MRLKNKKSSKDTMGKQREYFRKKPLENNPCWFFSLTHKFLFVDLKTPLISIGERVTCIFKYICI